MNPFEVLFASGLNTAPKTPEEWAWFNSHLLSWLAEQEKKCSCKPLKMFNSITNLILGLKHLQTSAQLPFVDPMVLEEGLFGNPGLKTIPSECLNLNINCPLHCHCSLGIDWDNGDDCNEKPINKYHIRCMCNWCNLMHWLHLVSELIDNGFDTLFELGFYNASENCSCGCKMWWLFDLEYRGDDFLHNSRYSMKNFIKNTQGSEFINSLIPKAEYFLSSKPDQHPTFDVFFKDELKSIGCALRLFLIHYSSHTKYIEPLSEIDIQLKDFEIKHYFDDLVFGDGCPNNSWSYDDSNPY